MGMMDFIRECRLASLKLCHSEFREEQNRLLFVPLPVQDSGNKQFLTRQTEDPLHPRTSFEDVYIVYPSATIFH
jgi:hypothetical protein